MYNFPIGIILDCFKKPALEALDIVASLGAQGIQVYATRGEMSPENLVGEKRSAATSDTASATRKIIPCSLKRASAF